MSGAPEAGQDHMGRALNFLQDAKKSDHPLPLLKEAKSELDDASHKKAGFRTRAIELVDKAIAHVTLGEKDKITAGIDAAITSIHAGMAAQPRK